MGSKDRVKVTDTAAHFGATVSSRRVGISLTIPARSGTAASRFLLSYVVLLHLPARMRAFLHCTVVLGAHPCAATGTQVQHRCQR